MQNELGSSVCQQLLFVHAISGCDTTSALYGLGKAIFMRKAKKSTAFIAQANKFLLPDIDKTEIEHAFERVLVDVYGGRQQDSINKLRYIKYNQKLCSHALCHLHKQLLSFMLEEHTTKFKNGAIWRMTKIYLIH